MRVTRTCYEHCWFINGVVLNSRLLFHSISTHLILVVSPSAIKVEMYILPYHRKKSYYIMKFAILGLV